MKVAVLGAGVLGTRIAAALDDRTIPFELISLTDPAEPGETRIRTVHFPDGRLRRFPVQPFYPGTGIGQADIALFAGRVDTVWADPDGKSSPFGHELARCIPVEAPLIWMSNSVYPLQFGGAVHTNSAFGAWFGGGYHEGGAIRMINPGRLVLVSDGRLLPDLGFEPVARRELWVKAVMNLLVNPLACACDVRNGGLMEIPWAQRATAAMIRAVSRLPHFSDASHAAAVELEFTERYRQLLLATADNACSSLAGFRRGELGELPYFSQPFVVACREAGLTLPVLEQVHAFCTGAVTADALRTALQA